MMQISISSQCRCITYSACGPFRTISLNRSIKAILLLSSATSASWTSSSTAAFGIDYGSNEASIHCMTFWVEETSLAWDVAKFFTNCFILSIWPVAVKLLGSLFIGLNVLNVKLMWLLAEPLRTAWIWPSALENLPSSAPTNFVC